MSEYTVNSDAPPVAYSSSIESSDGGMSCCAVSMAYTSNSDPYNNGTINTDPVYAHIQSLVRGQILYRLVNDAPLIIESTV